MISRLVTAAALVAGAALFWLPAQAQTGTTSQDTIKQGGASPSGSPGTTMGTTGATPQQTAGRMRGGAAAERQMTECLNNAASQQRPLDSCRR
jgi:hypothetical protein